MGLRVHLTASLGKIRGKILRLSLLLSESVPYIALAVARSADALICNPV